MRHDYDNQTSKSDTSPQEGDCNESPLSPLLRDLLNRRNHLMAERARITQKIETVDLMIFALR